MPTIRQKRLARAIIENAKREKPLTKQELVVSSGYSEISAESSAHILLENKGVKEALNDYGFNPDAAKKVVAEILNKEKALDKDRLKASDMIFKVHGTYAPDKVVSVNVEAETNPEVKELTAKLNEIYRGTSSPSDGGTTSTLGSQTSDKE